MPTNEPKPTKRQARGEASRRRLVEQATRLFGLYGYSSVSMREIGAAAGLDNSSIYRHFKSKQDLAATVVQQVLSDLAPVAARLDLSREPTLGQLVDVVVAFSSYLWQRPDVARLLLSWMSTTGEPRSGFSFSVRLSDNPDHLAARTVQAIMDWLDAAQANGSIRPIAPIDALVNILAITVVRPATANYFLNSIDSDSSPGERQRAAESELRDTIRGAFAPQKG